ncbi:MAG: monovalent cation/H+ antiporter subunit D family protein [Pseudomonadota bacterium]
MTFTEQLPVLPIITPLLLAPITILLPKGRAAWAWATLVSWLVFFFCTSLLVAVYHHDGPISYALGDWMAPLGIEYRIDLANGLLLFLISGMGALVFPYAYHSINAEIDERQTPMFYAALLLCMTGLLGVTITGDAFNVFVFFEIASLSTYALVALGARQDRRALTAAFNYLVMGTIGATFFVIGVGLLYQATGTLNMEDLRVELTSLDNRMVQSGFAFIFVGMGLKLAMFPLHLWLPGAYAYAPSAVSAFVAATSTKVALYVLIRFFYTIFHAAYGIDFGSLYTILHYVLMPLAVAGMFVASLVAVFQDCVKRMLAYSSVGQIGYMLLGLSLGTTSGLTATMVHMFNHALMKGALFMAVGCVVLRLGGHTVSQFRGLFYRMPITATAFLVAGLSLVGVPLTVGFVSKWTLLQGTFEAGYWPASFLIVASSLIAVVYVGRIIEIMIRKPENPAPAVSEAPLSMLVPMILLVVANLYFGLQTDLTVDTARGAADALFVVSEGAH